jgi:hypothetical protein
MEEQRLLILHEEVIELQVELRNVNRDAEDVWGDFVDVGHGEPSCMGSHTGGVTNRGGVTGQADVVFGFSRTYRLSTTTLPSFRTIFVLSIS